MLVFIACNTKYFEKFMVSLVAVSNCKPCFSCNSTVSGGISLGSQIETGCLPAMNNTFG